MHISHRRIRQNSPGRPRTRTLASALPTKYAVELMFIKFTLLHLLFLEHGADVHIQGEFWTTSQKHHLKVELS